VATQSSDGNVNAFRILVRFLNEADRVAEGEADPIILQCNKFLDEVVSTHKSVFLLTAVARLIICFMAF